MATEDNPAQDGEIVRGVLGGQREALERLAKRMMCVPRILAARNARYGRPLDEHDLADLTQDVLLVLVRKLDRFSGQVSLDAWAYTIACLEYQNALRRKARRPRSIEGSEAASTQTRGATDPEPWEHEELYRGLERLGGDEAELIRLKHFEDLSFEALGQRLRVPTSTIKARYYRGMARLRELMRPRDTERRDERTTLE